MHPVQKVSLEPCIVLENISASFECGKKTKPYLSHFLKVQLRKSMEPVADLTDIEKLDLETTRQKEGCRLVVWPTLAY